VQILGADPKTTHLKPRWQDTEVMESIVSALKPVSDLTDILSGEKRVTASCLKPLLSHLHDEALAEKEGELGGTTLKVDIQQRIKQYMKRKYDDESIKSMLNISSCLDPRFMLKKCSDDETFFVRQSIVQQGVVIARRMEEQHPSRDEREKESTDASCSATPAKKTRLVDIFTVSSVSSPKEAVSNEERVKEELRRYLGYNQPEIHSKPLEWWKCHSKELPCLSTLVKKYLS